LRAFLAEKILEDGMTVEIFNLTALTRIRAFIYRFFRFFEPVSFLVGESPPKLSQSTGSARS
jgi:hypothetical protein